MSGQGKAGWFDVDKEGLAKLLSRKGKSFVLLELVQNAWDTRAGEVVVEVGPVGKRGVSEISVKDDDPDGFRFLHHAWTLFAESEKKGQAEKRGRFNLGEKLVLAVCESANLITTKGGVSWDRNGRTELLGSTVRGSTFRASVRMTEEEREEAIRKLTTLIPPHGIRTVVNGEEVGRRQPVETFRAQLPTEVADADGHLRPGKRVARVELYEPLPGEAASVYELGIPVVETGDRWHVNVCQKVPLNADRDNVTPGFLKALRVAVLNEAYERIGEEDATAEWVREAGGDARCGEDPIRRVMDLRFGERRVAADPSDQEGTKIALAKDYQVVFAGALSKGEWENVRKAGAILPAGQVTPSRPQGLASCSRVEESDAMARIGRLVRDLGRELLGVGLEVQFVSSAGSGTLADFSKEERKVRFNVALLGREWFEHGPRDHRVLDLILHEFGHWRSGDHRSALYHEALSDLGARLAVLALKRPETFA